MALKENLKRVREGMAWTQEELARRIGVSPSLVGRYENGSAFPTLLLAQQLSVVLGVTIDELVKGA